MHELGRLLRNMKGLLKLINKLGTIKPKRGCCNESFKPCVEAGQRASSNTLNKMQQPLYLMRSGLDYIVLACTEDNLHSQEHPLSRLEAVGYISL